MGVGLIYRIDERCIEFAGGMYFLGEPFLNPFFVVVFSCGPRKGEVLAVKCVWLSDIHL